MYLVTPNNPASHHLLLPALCPQLHSRAHPQNNLICTTFFWRACVHCCGSICNSFKFWLKNCPHFAHFHLYIQRHISVILEFGARPKCATCATALWYISISDLATSEKQTHECANASINFLYKFFLPTTRIDVSWRNTRDFRSSRL